MKYAGSVYAEFVRCRGIPTTILSLAVLLSFGVFADPPPANVPARDVATSGTNSGPKISFAESLFDFGKVDSGTLVKHDYIFTNTGSQTLEVTKVQPGCGCTTASPWDKTVEPGKTGIVPIQFNSTGYGGQVVKTITISCNDPDQTNLILQLKGTVWKPIDVIPTFAMFNINPETPTNETKVVRIISRLEEPLTLSEPVCSNSAFQTSLKEIKEGKEFELRVTVVPPLTNNVSTPITLKTSSQKVPSLNLSAYAMVVPVIALAPTFISLPAGPLPSENKPSVTIKNNGTNSLSISQPAVNVPDAEVQLQELETGRIFALNLKFPAGFRIQPGQRVEASFKTTNPGFPVMKVPIYQALASPAADPAPPPKTAASPSSLAPQQGGVASAALSPLTSATPANAKK